MRKIKAKATIIIATINNRFVTSLTIPAPSLTMDAVLIPPMFSDKSSNFPDKTSMAVNTYLERIKNHFVIWSIGWNNNEAVAPSSSAPLAQKGIENKKVVNPPATKPFNLIFLLNKFNIFIN
ncbi:MAG: hypothetical protein COU81_01470 [Candidatus Portnoybacteria bacterium CG10_big_fil_rev_8_21_14_0_10_36_7]|uniref:Uncharacterized protein n=1 Tax=Candidatus Portnoybacteria bacterium CG10_big_fil_rev_8_21_14_0_10_36_7 TaxID=1974812 RepID=A0A2M8KEG7_9BACT|nr:MAG: hypothetical protein COU81_01470 [Candidatus Portnoybacteria bacterium CG10_big_fil_rev_8_21_14_0_10_36_7]